ncbi:Hypothetical protein A7982_01789 [Minicystis rosea]|nr:Hypothetical protein A7982_01789 [Minicystis rosea]
MVVIQQISVTWSKAARGAPAAVLRNALPRSLPLIPAMGAYVYQRHSFFEKKGQYVHRLIEETSLDHLPRTTRSIEHLLVPAGLSVGVVWTAYDGQPRRRSRPEALLLPPDGLGRVITNGRHTTSRGGQYYTRDVYNIALVQHAEEDLFMRGTPMAICDFQANLF